MTVHAPASFHRLIFSFAFSLFNFFRCKWPCFHVMLLLLKVAEWVLITFSLVCLAFHHMMKLRAPM